MQDVIQLLRGPHTEKEIAARLDLSPHTVHGYIKFAYKRLGVTIRAELLARLNGNNAF